MSINQRYLANIKWLSGLEVMPKLVRKAECMADLMMVWRCSWGHYGTAQKLPLILLRNLSTTVGFVSLVTSTANVFPGNLTKAYRALHRPVRGKNQVKFPSTNEIFGYSSIFCILLQCDLSVPNPESGNRPPVWWTAHSDFKSDHG